MSFKTILTKFPGLIPDKALAVPFGVYIIAPLSGVCILIQDKAFLPFSVDTLWIADALLYLLLIGITLAAGIKLFKGGKETFIAATVCLGILLRVTLSMSAELGVDEAHYGLYGMFPALSYFDHPPMVGWINAVVLLFVKSDIALRIVPEVLHLLSLFLLCRITRLFSADYKAIVWTVIFYESSLLIGLLGIALIPETVLIPLVLAFVLVLERMYRLKKYRDWLWIGLILGAMGLTKYTAIFFTLGIVPIILHNPRILLSRYFVGAIGIALGCVMPVIIWNYNHQWLSFVFQFERGFSGNNDYRLLLVMMAAYILLYGFAPVWTLIKASIGIFGQQKPNWMIRRILGFTALPLFFITWLNAYKGVSLPHWVAVSVLLYIPQAASQMAAIPLKKNRWDRAYVWGSILTTVLLGVFWVAGTYLLIADYPWLKNQKHPKQEIVGWKEAALTARSQASDKPFFLPNRFQLSRIAWYAYPTNVYSFSSGENFYTLQFGQPKAGENGILIIPFESTWQRFTEAIATYTSKFEQCRHVADIPLPSRFAATPIFSLFDCKGLKAVE